jgi:AraC-like DNA-binding protein
MELVRAATLTGYFAVAAELRLDPLPLLRAAGLTRSALAEPDRMFPARAVVGLLEASAAASQCDSFALRMAARRSVADLGLVSLLLAHQPTLREALGVMQRYRNRINSTLVLQIGESAGTAVLHEHFALDPPLVSRQADELAMGVIAGLGKWMLGEAWRVEEARFAHAGPRGQALADHARLFGCPLRFGSDHVGLVLRASVLDLPNPRADPALAAQARRMADTLIGDAPLSLAQEVEEAVLRLLPGGVADLATTARALGLNPRTLQRRLDAAGTSFAAILESVRRRLAAQCLSNPRLSLTDAAQELGYASLSAFTRWYRASHGMAPSKARRG